MKTLLSIIEGFLKEKGDEYVEEKLFNDTVLKYSDMVYRIAYSYCKNKEDAEDIYQNVFLKLLKTQKDFEQEDYKKRWLIRVTVNECHSLFLSPWRKHRKECENVEQLLEEQEAAIYEESKERESEVLAMLNGLSKRYRTVLYLYFYEEYSVKEIAEILNKKESTIRTQIMRGKEQLRERIAK